MWYQLYVYEYMETIYMYVVYIVYKKLSTLYIYVIKQDVFVYTCVWLQLCEE